MSRVIGFYGSDKVEVLLYLARILNSLDYNVLLQDLSESKALTLCICKQYMDLTDDEIIDYTYNDIDFDYSRKEEYKDYDFVLIDLGYNSKEIDICDEIWFFTDIQCHNIMRLKYVNIDKDKKRILIVKDFLNGKISKKYIMGELSNLELSRDPYIMYFEQDDLRLAIDCQYNNISHFAKLSEEYLELLVEQLEELNIPLKNIKKALKRVGRGNDNGFDFF